MTKALEHYLEVVVAYNKFGLDYVKSNFGIMKEDTVRRYRDWLLEANIPIPESEKSFDKVKILVFDIETSTTTFRLFRTGKQYVPAQAISESSFMICWSGIWLHNQDVAFDRVTPEEALKRDDKRICKSLHDTLEQADIIVGHNINRFDLPIIISKFAQYGFKSLPPYQTYDTLTQARKLGKFDSYGLDFLCKTLGLGSKIETNAQLWEDCERGDEESLRKMLKYCRHDVEVNAKLYYFLRGKTKGHPNLALYVEDSEVCPVCLGNQFEVVRNYKTSVNKYLSYRCTECGSIKRSRKRIKMEGEQEFVPTAR